MATTIRLAGIEASGRHGVYPAEKECAQRFVVDVECDLDRSDIADDLATTVDYDALAGQIAQVVGDESYDLIETLASRVGAVCLAYELVRRVRITVHKPQARLSAPVADVAVTIEMGREAP